MSAERFTLDTNILIYAIDRRDPVKQGLAAEILKGAAWRDCPLALQVLGEFYVAATKLKLPAKDVASNTGQLMKTFETFGYSSSAMRGAVDEASRGRISLWDGVLLSSAAEAGCTVILSEDMQDGARFGSIEVANPFKRGTLSERVQTLLGG